MKNPPEKLPENRGATLAGLPRSMTVVHFLPGDFIGAGLKNLEPVQFPAGVFAVKEGGKPASLTSPELSAAFPFDQLLFSFDASFSAGSVLGAEAQVKTAAGWSPWFSFGRFTPGAGGRSAAAQANSFGRMDVDILRLNAKATAYRYRVLISAPAGTAPVLRLAAAVYTDSSAPYSARYAAPKAAARKAVKLEVPRYSQMAQRVAIAGDICSPVSLAMVLTCLGRKTGPLDATSKVLDAAGNIYGNWFFNTAQAGAEGFYSFLARLDSLDEARFFVEAGIPVIASVTFGPGELKNSPIEKTRGHLMVIKGFDARGNIIVNDPAAPRSAGVQRVYDRDQFASAWLKNKFGTCYIVTPSLSSFLSVKAPVTDFFSRPPKAAAEHQELIESQLLENERVELLGTDGPWARVRALEQPSLKADRRKLRPYEGWLPLGALEFSLPQPPTAVVRAKTAGKISIGVKLRAVDGPKPGLGVAVLGAREAVIKAGDLNPLPLKPRPAGLRRKILDTARLFLGDKYYWGGRSAWGIDCSGLVNISYRAWGLDLPRNAHDQFAAARRLKKAQLKPADLVFTARAGNPAITHVMLYAGGGRLIEATRDSGDVREVTFLQKFGTAFPAVKDGAVVGGRRIYFGTLL